MLRNLLKFVRPLFCKLGQWKTFGLRLADGFIVEVCDITGVLKRLAIDFKDMLQGILNKKRTEVADVRVHRRSATAIKTQRLARLGLSGFTERLSVS